MEQGTYPLLIEGARAGDVRVTLDGGWTYFDVQCAMIDGIVRVSVYGGGREGYLGVLAPCAGALTLQRRFSREALRDFPETIEYAARAGQPCAAPEPEALPEPEAEPEAEAPMPEPAPEPESVPAPEPEPPPPEGKSEAPPDCEDLYWYASPDGALVSFDGERSWIALPEGDARAPAGGRKKRIEGRDYVVFREKP